MAQSHEISFVTYPDGQVDERSITVCGERIAQQRFVSAWLPERFFGPSSELALSTLWRGAAEKGAFDPIELFRALPAPLPASPVSL